MFEKREENFQVDTAGIETIVGSSVKLKGNLKSDGDITINGSVSGDVRTKSSVQIGSGANVVASVKARNVQISGVVQGNIEATETLELRETGKVYGDIQAGVLVVSPGAIFSGKCTMLESKKDLELEPILEVEEEEAGEKKEKSEKK